MKVSSPARLASAALLEGEERCGDREGTVPAILNMGYRKYKAQRTNGYASKREADVAANLHILADRKKIVGLVEQPRYTLLPACEGYPRPLEYRADFSYVEADTGKGVVMDAKGFRTKEYIIKKRLMKQLLGIEVTEV